MRMRGTTGSSGCGQPGTSSQEAVLNTRTPDFKISQLEGHEFAAPSFPSTNSTPPYQLNQVAFRPAKAKQGSSPPRPPHTSLYCVEFTFLAFASPRALVYQSVYVRTLTARHSTKKSCCQWLQTQVVDSSMRESLKTKSDHRGR